MSSQNFSSADVLLQGTGYFPALHDINQKRGAVINTLTKVSLGAPIAPVTDALIKAATSTELPATAGTTTYIPGVVTSPLDSASLPAAVTITTALGDSATVWPLDVPRNVTSAVTHGSAVVAMTLTITGYDVYKAKVIESLAITAGTTSKAAAGKKAFAYIESIAITVAADATANTLNMGFGDVLGLPYKLANKSDCIGVWFNDAADASATVVKAVTTTATATTGDVRGTVDPNSACDGSAVAVWMHVTDKNSAAGLVGVPQYAG